MGATRARKAMETTVFMLAFFVFFVFFWVRSKKKATLLTESARRMIRWVNETKKSAKEWNGRLNEVVLNRMEREDGEGRYIASAFIYDTSRWLWNALTP